MNGVGTEKLKAWERNELSLLFFRIIRFILRFIATLCYVVQFQQSVYESEAPKQAKTLKSLPGGHAATPHDSQIGLAHPHVPNGSYGS